jgi:hypothetical protein
LFSICLSATLPGQQVQSVKQYLEELLGDPLRMPQHGEGLRVLDQVATMQHGDVLAVVPLIFEGLVNERGIVNIQSALALTAVSLRSDANLLLGPRHEDILALLVRDDVRLAMTAPSVIERIQIPPEKYLPTLWSYVADDRWPAQGKPASICLLTRVAPHEEQTHAAIAAFLKQDMQTRDRVQAISSLGCVPADDEKVMGLIIEALDDPERDVRLMALAVLDRYAIKDTVCALASAPLSRIAGNPDEDPSLRRSAEKLLGAQ